MEPDDARDYHDDLDDDEDGDEWVFDEHRPAEGHSLRKRGDSAAENEDDVPRGWNLLPFERQWQVDKHWLETRDEAEEGGHTGSLQTSFRSCVQSHTDWINDMVLCNQNQSGELSLWLFHWTSKL